MDMLDAPTKARMEKQQYRIVGSHSAVKVCGWTKHMIKGEGGCYKLKFYGIMSNQCLQMTTSMSCANRCIFCWRDYKSPVAKEWKWNLDSPEIILEGALHAQKKLLEGFGGNPKAIKAVYEASKDVKHVALSLNGEPINYPKINELIALFDRNGISTFLVMNGQHLEELKTLRPVTQLYLSLDAPNKELLKNVTKPLFTDYWERMQGCLDCLSEKKHRTAIRITMIKGLNDVEPENYAELIKKGNPDFLELKAYMHIGASQERLSRASMPMHEEVVAFAKELEPFLKDYEMMAEHVPSRVVLFAKKKFKKDGEWQTWIDFKKYTEYVNGNKNDWNQQDYMRKTPERFVGINPESKTFSFKDLKNDPRRTYVEVCEEGEEIDLE